MVWPVNARTSAMMDEAQSLYGATITATQGSPSTSVGASALTHAGEGVIDVVGADLDAIVVAMRQVGFAAWHRTPAQGFVHHVHGVAVGEPLLHPQAQTQVDSYFAGHNGLRGNGLDDGPRDWVGITWETYNGGTYIPPTGGGPVAIYGQFPGDRSGTLAQDGGILTGTPTWTVDVGSPPSTKLYLGGLPGPVANASGLTLTLNAGDSIAIAVNEDWYYDSFENLTKGYYMLRVEGAGALEVADTYDLGWNYPSGSWTWTAQTLVGDDGEFRYYTVDPTLLDESHLWNDGQPLIRLTCTSGTVDITWAGMRINQVQGFFNVLLDEDDNPVTAWSGTQPASYWEPFPDGTDTYAVTTIGTDQFWTVDATPVLVASGNDRWEGEGASFVDVQDSLDLANADMHSQTTLNVAVASVSSEHEPVSLVPERWVTRIRDGVNVISAPTKSVLDPPPELADLESWNLQEWEWLDTDSYLLGWHFYGQDDVRDDGVYDHCIGVSGDADTVTLVYHLHNTDVDLETSFPDPGSGTVIASGSSIDTPPGTDPSLIPITDSFVTSTSNLLITQLQLGRRTVAFEDKYTTEYGYPPGAEGTAASLAAIRESDSANITVNHSVARYRRPIWRYASPTFTADPGPTPTIDFDEDPSVTYLRNRQRNDGLGGWSVPRAKGISSQQRSIHNRGYR